MNPFSTNPDERLISVMVCEFDVELAANHPDLNRYHRALFILGGPRSLQWPSEQYFMCNCDVPLEMTQEPIPPFNDPEPEP